jgi:hypothetical protein
MPRLFLSRNLRMQTPGQGEAGVRGQVRGCLLPARRACMQGSWPGQGAWCDRSNRGVPRRGRARFEREADAVAAEAEAVALSRVAAASAAEPELEPQPQLPPTKMSEGSVLAEVGRSFACIGSPCLRQCVHGASIGSCTRGGAVAAGVWLERGRAREAGTTVGGQVSAIAAIHRHLPAPLAGIAGAAP